MVRGLNTFRENFADYPDNYIIIGGTACDIIIEAAELTPRATRDIDIILIVEALTPAFGNQFWNFIANGAYERREQSENERKYYRFQKPANENYPYQIELFSKRPDVLTLPNDAHLTPIPIHENISSLSAILLNQDYYKFTLHHSNHEHGIHIANIEALICLKAMAYLNFLKRIAASEQIDSRNIKKHKGDIFRLGAMLAANDKFLLPESIKSDMQEFANSVKNELPGKELYKDMGLPNSDVIAIYNQIITSFGLQQ